MDIELQNLLDDLLTGKLTEESKLRLLSLLEKKSIYDSFTIMLEQQLANKDFALDVELPETEQAFVSQVFLKSGIDCQSSSQPSIAVQPAHRVHFLSRGFFRYAAAVLILLGLGIIAYLWTNNKNGRQIFISDKKHLQTDIRPGGEKAILTLADGTKIVLDSAANGNLANQGNVQIVKMANGQISYNLKGSARQDVMMNTMLTPKGGQYQLTLPDGTKVWLNAASSITYPAVFVGKERSVKVNGEAYFEVAKNEQQPFVVDVNGKLVVEVLGTSFNINSYANEADIKTTLIEGMVKVLKTKSSVILKKGQQATVSDAPAISVVNDADIDKALAWKNGQFNFDGLDLRGIIRQLERWYDIEVEYRGAIDNATFKGKIDRSVHLSEVLKMLEALGEEFQLEGKKLIVL